MPAGKISKDLRIWFSEPIEGITVEAIQTCPKCGQPVKFGDGGDTPPLYCDDCGIGWNTPEDIERGN